MSTLNSYRLESSSTNQDPHPINAAFLQEIKEDHQRFRELLREASNLLSIPRRVRPHELNETLAALRDQLAMHFALENAYGYLDNALEIAPRLCRRAQRLRNEHDTLFADFQDIVEQCEQLLYHETTPRRKLTQIAVMFFDFQARLQAHEACENELIFEAFDDDVGVGD